LNIEVAENRTKRPTITQAVVETLEVERTNPCACCAGQRGDIEGPEGLYGRVVGRCYGVVGPVGFSDPNRSRS